MKQINIRIVGKKRLKKLSVDGRSQSIVTFRILETKIMYRHGNIMCRPETRRQSPRRFPVRPHGL